MTNKSVNTGWLHAPTAIAVIGGAAILGLMLVSFLYAVSQVPGSVQPCAVGKVDPPRSPDPLPEATCADGCCAAKCETTPAGCTCLECKCGADGSRGLCAIAPPEPDEGEGELIEELPPVAPLQPNCLCSDACTCDGKTEAEPCRCSELVPSVPNCKPIRNCRPRARFFRRRH